MQVISSCIPFPNIYWWSVVHKAEKLCIDVAEHFEKMTYRNKYFITGANGGIQLSIPLENGREQRAPMGGIQIHNRERWQIQHWRTIVSVYKRTPFFEYYEHSLESLFTQEFNLLTDFNLASIHWLKQQLKCNFEEEQLSVYKKDYPEATFDFRQKFKPGAEKQGIAGAGSYYQVFSDRNGFLPNLSMLDLLFAEGPHAISWLQQHEELIQSWNKK